MIIPIASPESARLRKSLVASCVLTNVYSFNVGERVPNFEIYL